jgi:hypothetical protein
VDALRRLDRRRQRLQTAMRWLSMHRSRRYGGRVRESRLLAWHEERARLLALRERLDADTVAAWLAEAQARVREQRHAPVP